MHTTQNYVKNYVPVLFFFPNVLGYQTADWYDYYNSMVYLYYSITYVSGIHML